MVRTRTGESKRVRTDGIGSTNETRSIFYIVGVVRILKSEGEKGVKYERAVMVFDEKNLSCW